MTLIKNKINSLAWLKSAIYASVIGGILSSFTPVLAATLSPGIDNERRVTFFVNQYIFGIGTSPLYYRGANWQGTVTKEERNGSSEDNLVIRVYLQHIHNPHQGESELGRQLNLNFRVASSSENDYPIIDSNIAEHPGIRHFDLAEGVLNVNTFHHSKGTGISSWDLMVSADHNVPEPGTILSAAVALGWGGWLKRKNLVKQDKTKSQG
jgi:hypothetical protein